MVRRLTGRSRVLIVLVAAVVTAGALVAIVVPGASASKPVAYQGITVSPPKQAPPLVLDNYLGTPVDLTHLRGKAVLLTFIYTHCPDTCPLIVSKLHTAQAQMSADERSRLAIVAVSVDPKGDTRAAVAHFLSVHQMTGRMQYLVGSPAALLHTWSNWGIASKRVPNTPDQVEHTALIYGITGHGKIAALYPANFSVGEIIHDVGLLARA